MTETQRRDDRAGANDLGAYRLEVEAWRGDQFESRHQVFCAALGATPLAAGRCLPEQLPVTFWRSAAKPFQLLPLLTASGVERFGFDRPDLAVMCASHDGTEAHAQRVAGILRRLGLGPQHLLCGVHRPYYLDDLPADSPEGLRPFGPLHNNCSGNHAAMLALALQHGVEPSGYLDPGGPGQQRAHAVIEAVSGAPRRLAIDSCSAPCYALPLGGMAEAYGFLAAPSRVRALQGERRRLLESVATAERAEAELERIAAAMATEPEWVSGAGNAATRLARLLPGELVIKNGAEGVLCVAHRGLGAALALKVADGNARALVPALVFLATELGWLQGPQRAQIADLAQPVVRGRTGQAVGKLRVVPDGS